jgi:hypothetical protein
VVVVVEETESGGEVRESNGVDGRGADVDVGVEGRNGTEGVTADGNLDGKGDERGDGTGDEKRDENRDGLEDGAGEEIGCGRGGEEGIEGENEVRNITQEEDDHTTDTQVRSSSPHPAQQTVEGTGPEAQQNEVETGQAETEAEIEDGKETGDDIDDDTDTDTDTDENTRVHRASSVSSTATLTFPPYVSPLDVVDIELKLHGTYTTIHHANRAALATFLELAKPKNSSIEDNHHYKYDLKPGITESFEENGMGERNCTTVAEIPWDPPRGKQYRWDFLRLEVEVIESELKGPVDIGDMVVEGGGDNGQEEGGPDGVVSGVTQQQNSVREEAMGRKEVDARKLVGALPSPLEESGGEISEED